MGKPMTAGESADPRTARPREPAWHRRARRDRAAARLLLGVTRAVACLSGHHAQPCRAADRPLSAGGPPPSSGAAAPAAGCPRPPGGSTPFGVPAEAEGRRGYAAAPAASGPEEEGRGDADARGWHDLPYGGSEPSYPAPPRPHELQEDRLEDAPRQEIGTSTAARSSPPPPGLHALQAPQPPQEAPAAQPLHAKAPSPKEEEEQPPLPAASRYRARSFDRWLETEFKGLEPPPALDRQHPAAAAAEASSSATAAETCDLATLHAGGHAYATGLRNRPELNFECLELLWFDAAAGRWVCEVGDGEQVRLRPVNLVYVPDILSGDEDDP